MSESMQGLVDRLAGDDEELKKELLAYGRERQTEVELEELLGEAVVGRDLMVKAAAVLKERGIAVEAATQEELRAALIEVSS